MNWKDLDTVFTKARKVWGGNGSGSVEDRTRMILSALRFTVLDLGATSIVDIGCGTLGWIVPLIRDLENRYVGVDVVASVIEENRQRFPELSFEVLADHPLPRGDLVLCRDVMAHLPSLTNLAILEKIRESGAKWLIATTHLTRSNTELAAAGGFRLINLSTRPYYLGREERILADHKLKRMGVWPVARNVE